LAFAGAISSLIELIGNEAPAASTSVVRPVMLIGAKSFTGSNGSFTCSAGIMASAPTLPSSKV
jgi:hypothetical protein